MTDICHMDSNLMSSPGFKCYLHETEFFTFKLKRFYSLVVCYCISSFDGIFYSHFEAIAWITTDNRADGTYRFFWFSDDES